MPMYMTLLYMPWCRDTAKHPCLLWCKSLFPSCESPHSHRPLHMTSLRGGFQASIQIAAASVSVFHHPWDIKNSY